jgi:hypothetical protein
MRVSFLYLAILSLLSTMSLAAPVCAVHPLEFDKGPLDFSKKMSDEMQADFGRLVRKSGAATVDCPELKKQCKNDNNCLQALAHAHNALYAIHALIDLSLENIITLSVRVVRSDGEVVGTQLVKMPLGKDKFAALGRVAMAKAIEELKLMALPETIPVKTPDVVAKPKDVPIKAPDVVIKPPDKVVEPIVPAETDGQWMKPTGLVVGGVGLASAVAGAVIFASAPSKDLADQFTIPLGREADAKARTASQTLGIGILAGGAALAVAGAAVYLLAPAEVTKPETKISIVPTSTGAAFMLEGKF